MGFERSVLICDLFELEDPLFAELFRGATYPWEVLPILGDFLSRTVREGLPGYTEYAEGMNAAVRLYADAANAKTKLENGFDLTDYDKRTLAFAKEYSDQLLAIDVNLNTEEMLDVTWRLFAKHFVPEEVNIRKEFIEKYWVR